MNIFNRIFNLLSETRWKFRLSGSNVRIKGNGSLRLGKDVSIINCKIYIDNNSSIIIGDHVRLSGIQIFVTKGGLLRIGNHSILEKERNSVSPEYIIENSNVNIGEHTLIKVWRVWCRFGGELKIGNYTNINFGSEIRCDKIIHVGDFCQISYNVKIWDTNTHSILPFEERRNRTINDFPSFGREFSTPTTAPVTIGDDCWIGESASILKGTVIGNRTIIGYHTLVSNVTIPSDSRVVSQINLRITNN